MQERPHRYVLTTALWAGCGYFIARALLGMPHLVAHLPLVAAFAVLVGLLTALRVKVGHVVLSAVVLVTLLSITVLGGPIAAAIQLAGVVPVALARTVDGRPRSRASGVWQWLLFDGPMFMASSLVGGWVYGLAGGVVGAERAPAGEGWILSFLAMAVAALLANVLILTVHRRLVRPQDPVGLFADLVKRLYVSWGIYLAVGIPAQAFYYEAGVVSLPVIVGILLLLRYVFRVQAENRAVRGEMARALTDMLEMRDPYTGGHVKRVAMLAVATGVEMGLNEDQLERLRDSGLLHDIGKVAVPDAVLRKEGPLDREEWALMDVHAPAGGQLLEGQRHLRDLVEPVAGHHEHLEGQSLEARVLSAADAFDAMTSDRPYRAALPEEEAVRRLRAGVAKGQFDGRVVEALIRAVRRMGGVAAVAPKAIEAGRAPT